jgi:hypothetical protein
MSDIPAFPHVQLRDPTTQFTQTGMTLRDYFAGQAVMGLIACSTVKTLDGQLLAESSYNVADAMIEARGE